MNFNFFRLVVFITALLTLGGAAHAANLNFNGATFPACTLSGQTYSCPTLPLGPTDSAVIASGYTVVVSSGISLSSGQGLQMSGSARLQTTGSNQMDLSGSQNLAISGGALAAGGNFKLGSNDQSITANVSAASVTTSGSSTRITGTVSATGLIDLGSNSTITGAVTAGSIKTGSSINLGGTLSVSGAITLGSSNTIAGAVSGASISTNSTVAMGPLTVGGLADLGSSVTINGALAAGSLKTNSSVTVNGGVTVNGQADLGSGIKISGAVSAGSVETNSPGQIGGGVTASGTIDLGSGVTVVGNVSGTVITTNSPVTITGAVSASTSFALASGGSVTGNITAPVVTLSASGVTVKGNIAAATSLDIGSGNTVNGNISGGALTLRSSGVTINGNATFTGDVNIGSSDTINGDLKARNVTTHASGDYISGNAAVNSIYLDWGATVGKTITCTGAGASGCSCVTKADGNYNPTCGAPASTPSPVDHIKITHNGQALTCQPQTVTLTACANSSCTLPHYNGSVDVTLQPGGGKFTISGGSGAGTVQQSTGTDAAGVNLVATSSLTSKYSCENTATSPSTSSCAMRFSPTGLVVLPTSHVAMSDGAVVGVQALKTGTPSCLPLLKSQQAKIGFSCSYNDPGPGNGNANAKVNVGGQELTCGGAAVDLTLDFDADGNAEPAPTLKYAEVGKVTITASYSGTGANAGLSATGNQFFITAPAKFKIEPVRVPTLPALNSGIFAKASEPFILKVTAVNAAGTKTANFGKESTKENFIITSAITTPNLNANPEGKIIEGEFDTVVDGVRSSKTGTAGQWRYHDVGVITMTSSQINGYYMGYMNDKFKSQSTQPIGPFIPDHFDTEVLSAGDPDVPSGQVLGLPMLCSKLNGLVKPCAAGDNFIYSKQYFLMRVTAYNGMPTPAKTEYYAGTLARDITLSAWKAPGDTDTTSPVPGAVFWPASIPAGQKFTFTGGVGKLAVADPAAAKPVTTYLPGYELPKAYPDPNVTAPTTVYLRAVDADGATSQRTGANEAPLTIVSGRMEVGNGNGALTGAMPVGVTAQFWSGTAYLFNSQYNAPAVSIDTFISYGNCQRALNIGTNAAPACPAGAFVKPAAPATLTFADGKASFRLGAPTPTLTSNGSVDVTLQTPSTATPANAPLIPWLPSTTGRQTFGIYRSGPVIYTREVHN
jgi:MSHA biogenesis protein MshQ